MTAVIVAEPDFLAPPILRPDGAQATDDIVSCWRGSPLISAAERHLLFDVAADIPDSRRHSWEGQLSGARSHAVIDSAGINRRPSDHERPRVAAKRVRIPRCQAGVVRADDVRLECSPATTLDRGLVQRRGDAAGIDLGRDEKEWGLAKQS